MGTTPNFSFPYPEPTDLVRDGAQNFEDLADAVDSTIFNLPAGGLELIADGTFSGASLSLTGIPGTFKELLFKGYGISTGTNAGMLFRVNNLSTSIYRKIQFLTPATTYTAQNSTTDYASFTSAVAGSTPRANFVAHIKSYADVTTTTGEVFIEMMSHDKANNRVSKFLSSVNSGIVTELNIVLSTSTFTNGDFELYGAN